MKALRYRHGDAALFTDIFPFLVVEHNVYERGIGKIGGVSLFGKIRIGIDDLCHRHVQPVQNL